MPDTITKKQQLQQVLDGGIGRHNYGKLVENIYDSFRSIDQAHSLLSELEAETAQKRGSAKAAHREKAGIFAYALGEFAKAAELLESAGKRTEAAHFLGRVLLRQNHFEKALEALESGRLSDDDFHTDRFVIEALCNLRDAGRAGKIYRSYEKTIPESPDRLYCRGRVLETEGEYEEAMHCYEKAVEMDENHRKSLFRLAFNCDLNGEDDRAIELYEKCASLQPTLLGALMNLGILYEDKEEYAKAIECYEKVLAVEPAHKRARLYLKDADAALHMSVCDDTRLVLTAQDRIMRKPIESFDLSSRCRHVLEKFNIKRLGDLIHITEEELLACDNFGNSSLQEIKDLLSTYGKSLKKSPEKIAESSDGAAEDEAEGEGSETAGAKIGNAGFSDDLLQILTDMDISTIDELTQYEEDELAAMYELEENYIDEIKRILARFDLQLKG